MERLYVAMTIVIMSSVAIAQLDAPLVRESKASRALFYLVLLIYVSASILDFYIQSITAARAAFVSLMIIMVFTIGNTNASYYAFGILALLVGMVRYGLGIYKKYIKDKVHAEFSKVQKQANENAKDFSVALDTGRGDFS